MINLSIRRKTMDIAVVVMALIVVTALPSAILSLLIANPAVAQQPAVAEPRSESIEAAFGALPGRWVRLQGGYVITIRAVDPDGQLGASYSNPRPLPFHKAFARSEGDVVKLSFELRAGGYNGSTYTLRYDAANDRLTGVYDQVVVKQHLMSFSSAINPDPHR